MLAALDQVEQELADGAFAFVPSDEDIHTAVERRVTELAGPAGAKLHTGRSRNDQVATDLRLFTKRELVAVAGRVLVLQQVLLELAEAAGDAYLPGYTHLQRAQPVLLAHHLLAHAWALSRDVDRLLDTRRRLDVSPLGAGALAGSSLALDPEGVAADLGFAAAFENSLDAVSDRDFVAEALFDLTLVGLHLSRIGEEVVLWSTEEFGFLEARRRLLDRQLDAPAEEEPRHRRAGPRQVRPPDRPPHRSARHPEGAAAGLQPRSAGGQGAAVRRARPGHPRAGGDVGAAGVVDVRAPRRWQLRPTARRPRPPTWPSTWSRRACRSATPTPSSEPWSVSPSRVGGALVDLVAQHESLGPDAVPLLDSGASVRRRTTRGGAGPQAVADQMVRFRERLATDRSRVEAAH